MMTDSLDDFIAEAWRRLARGAADRRSGFHTVQVASIGLDGGPRVRTVVLRAVEPSRRLIRFHTDARSPKVAELARDPRISVLAYDAAAKLQIRLTGTAEVLAEGAAAEQAWSGSRPMSRVCYRVARAPGDAITDPADGLPPAETDDPEAGRAVFRIVLCTAAALDVLYLAHDGHRRAACAYAADGTATATWLVP